MYCTHCGKEINDDALICPYCGVATQNFKNFEGSPHPSQKKNNLLSIFGFSLSLVSIVCLFISAVVFMPVSITAFVLSIIGTVMSKSLNSGKGLGIAGIVISSALLLFFVILFTLGAILTFSLFFFWVPFAV